MKSVIIIFVLISICFKTLGQSYFGQSWITGGGNSYKVKFENQQNTATCSCYLLVRFIHVEINICKHRSFSPVRSSIHDITYQVGHCGKKGLTQIAHGCHTDYHVVSSLPHANFFVLSKNTCMYE